MRKKAQPTDDAQALRDRIRDLETHVAQLKNERDAESAAQLKALRATCDKQANTIMELRRAAGQR